MHIFMLGIPLYPPPFFPHNNVAVRVLCHKIYNTYYCIRNAVRRTCITSTVQMCLTLNASLDV